MSTTDQTNQTSQTGRAVAGDGSDRGAVVAAWAGFLLGTAISVGGNVLATWLPKLTGEVTDSGWTPGMWPQVGAAVWPLALLVSVEVLTRTTWRAGIGWMLARLAGVFAVALGGAVISYGHLHEVLIAWKYPTAAAFVGPLVIDGLMLISGFALLSISKTRKTAAPATIITATPVAAAAAMTGTPSGTGDASGDVTGDVPGGTGATAAQRTAANRPERKPAAPRRRTAPGSRRATSAARRDSGTSDKQDKAWAHWQAERAAGRMPTGAELARVAGADGSMGRRWRRQWEDAEQAPEHPNEGGSQATEQAEQAEETADMTTGQTSATDAREERAA